MPPPASSQTSLPSHTGPMEREHLAALLLGARDEQMHDAGAQIETVQHHVARDHDRDQAEPQDLDHRAPPVAWQPLRSGP